MRFTVEVAGGAQLLRAFRGIEEGITDLRPAWPDVASAFYEIESSAFLTDGHGTWPELSPAYAEWKAVHFPFMPTMRATQSLYFALTRKGAKDGVYEETADTLTLGASGEVGRYGRSHMKSRGRRPARPPISLRDEDKRKLSRELQKYLRQLSTKSGFKQTSVSDFN